MMNNKEQLTKYLLVALLIIVLIILGLGIVLIITKIKERRYNKAIKEKEDEANPDKDIKTPDKEYTKESIFDFMEFVKIEDNMIIKNKGEFLMVVECQGINYDLMSEMEKVSVEQGFVSFLNTLRMPVQLYIQTRTVNLERSIENYRVKLEDIEEKYNGLKQKYEKMQANGTGKEIELEKLKYEVLKQKNLYDYTEDIIRDTERTSLNKNILTKKYYVIVSCYQSEMETGDFGEDEIRNMAFSELYTRARSVINSLFACEVVGRILDSEELVDLLYTAYNREEADVFGTDRAIKSGYEDLYSTAPDVLEKKEKLLDKQIEEEAIKVANGAIEKAMSEKEKEIIQKEENIDELVQNLAKSMIKGNEDYIGTKVAEKAIEKLENTGKKTRKKKGEKKDETMEEKPKRGRKTRAK